jgi:tRNA 5-methylaminomethyl-2-thiouridine biosynthesis bifunctional protein
MKYAELEWRDGQPYSPDYDDIYYSKAGGRSESEYVFIKQNDLPARWVGAGQFIIAETGFGTGLNFILTLKAWAESAQENSTLHYIGIEKYPVSPDDIRRLSESHPDLAEYFEELLSVYPLPIEGVHARTLLDGKVYLYLQFMDVVDALQNQQFAVDAWYLDGFGPAKNPDLWSEQVFKLLVQNSKVGTSLSTYTCAGVVRRGLVSAGFDVKKTAGHGKKREMITATVRQLSLYQSKTPWYEVTSPVIKNKEVTVIGAGLAGLSVAWSFVQRGWKVTVIDKHDNIAQEASGNPAGLVLPRLSIDNKYDSMFYSSAFLYAINQLDKLQQITDERIWFGDGVFSIYKQGNASTIIEKYDYPESFIKLLAEKNVPEHFRCESKDVSFISKAGWSSPGKVCKAIVSACSGSLTRMVADVCKINRVNGEWELLNEDGEKIVSSETVVIANGTGVTDVDMTSWLPVSAVRGQMTEVLSSAKSVNLRHALSFDAYVTPDCDGVHYVGASYSMSEKTKELLEVDQDENISRLEQMLPDMFTRPAELTGRVGFRPVSIDRVPIVGAVPDVEAFNNLYKDLHHGKPVSYYKKGQYQLGLYVSAAHGSRGMCSCFLSAEIVASMVEGSPLPVGREVSDMINPARFLIRNLRRNRYRDQ